MFKKKIIISLNVLQIFNIVFFCLIFVINYLPIETKICFYLQFNYFKNVLSNKHIKYK